LSQAERRSGGLRPTEPKARSERRERSPKAGRVVALAGVALSIGLIVVGIRSFPLDQVAHTLAAADLRWMLAGALFYLLPLPVRGLRWVTLLRAVKPVSVVTASEVYAFGTLANNVLPARLGDVARAFVLAKKEKISASSSFATIMLERIFDGLVVVGFFLTVLVIAPPTAGWTFGLAWAMGLVFSAAVLGSAFVAWQEERATKVAAFLVRPLPAALGEKILGLVKKLALGLHALKSARATATVIGCSILIWVLEAGVYAFVQQALGLDIPLHGLVVVMAVLTLGLTAPSAPGFVGVFEGLVIAGVGLYGVEGAPALAFALAVHAVHFSIGTLLGAIAAWRMGLRVRDIQTAAPAEALGAEASLQ